MKYISRLSIIVAACAFCAARAAAPASAGEAGSGAARQAEMEAYWAAQPEGSPVVPGRLLQQLKGLPWPDPRPVPKERYFERPDLKAGGQGADEGAQDESDRARYGLWMENYGFYVRAINDCETGRTGGPERVRVVEGLLTFLKEGTPRFHLRSTAEQAAGALGGLGERAALLAADLYKKGQYVPDAPSLLWAERLGGRLAAGLPVTAAERSAYYKIIARVRAFDPRAALAEGPGGAGKAPAPASAPRDEGWERFLAGLVGRCHEASSSINFSDLRADYRQASLREGAAIKEMLASFPPGWEKYPRAAWAHGWFSGALEKAAKDTSDAGRALELFKALDNYEAGLKAGR